MKLVEEFLSSVSKNCTAEMLNVINKIVGGAQQETLIRVYTYVICIFQFNEHYM